MEKANEFDPQAEILIQSATKRKNDQLTKEKIREKEFTLRKDIIQNYFLRMSNIHKRKMIMEFMDIVRTLEDVLHIMNFMFHVSKVPTFSMTDQYTNFTQDKQIMFDHDRMLDGAVLEQTIKDDLEWFDTIAGHNQVALIIELLRRAGGNVRRVLCIPLLKKYQQTLAKIKVDPTIYDVPIHRESLKRPLKPEHENYDPNHPSSIEVEKQRKKWEVMINKYKSEVEKAEKKLRNEPEQTEQGKASKKESKASKKASKASKKSKKSDNDKDKKDEIIDWIQLLPVWIVKKICGYLDQKTLKNLKKVNEYHSYVVGDLLKDMKMRKKLDSAIQKLETEIDPVKLEALKTGRGWQEAPYKLPKYVNKEEIGVTAAKLVPKKLKRCVQKSVLTETAIENDDFAPYEVATFPRVIKEDMLLYRYQPCFLRDVNLTLGAREDSDMHSSFGTYSLSSLTSSLVISVDEQTLSEW